MFYDNVENISHRLFINKILLESLNCHVFILKYREYDLLTSISDENKLIINVQTVLNYIRTQTKLNNLKLLIYEQSLNEIITIRLTVEN